MLKNLFNMTTRNQQSLFDDEVANLRNWHHAYLPVQFNKSWMVETENAAIRFYIWHTGNTARMKIVAKNDKNSVSNVYIASLENIHATPFGCYVKAGASNVIMKFAGDAVEFHIDRFYNGIRQDTAKFTVPYDGMEPAIKWIQDHQL